MSGLSIGLIGCGAWGLNVLRDLLALGCRTHVAEQIEAKRLVAAELGASSVAAEVANLPSDLDGYIVAVTTSCHFAVIRQLTATGKPIFVEKPMCPSVGQLEALREYDSQLFVMHKRRYHGGISKLAELAAERTLGNVLSIQCQRGEWGVTHTDVDATWILMPHDLSIGAHLLGALPEPRFASGLKREEPDLSGEDYFYELRGALGETSLEVYFEVSFRDTRCTRCITVLFDEGAAYLEHPMADHLATRRVPKLGQKGGQVEQMAIDTEMPLLKELRAFVRYLEGGDPPMSSFAFELELIKAIDALRAMAA